MAVPRATTQEQRTAKETFSKCKYSQTQIFQETLIFSLCNIRSEEHHVCRFVMYQAMRLYSREEMSPSEAAI